MAEEDNREDNEAGFMDAPEDDPETAEPADAGSMVPRDSNGLPVTAPMPIVEGSNGEVELPGPEAVAPDDSPNRLPADYAEVIRGPGSGAAPELVVPLPTGLPAFRQLQSLDSNATQAVSLPRREIELPIGNDRNEARDRELPPATASRIPGAQYLGTGGAPIGSSGQSRGFR